MKTPNVTQRLLITKSQPGLRISPSFVGFVKLCKLACSLGAGQSGCTSVDGTAMLHTNQGLWMHKQRDGQSDTDLCDVHGLSQPAPLPPPGPSALSQPSLRLPSPGLQHLHALHLHDQHILDECASRLCSHFKERMLYGRQTLTNLRSGILGVHCRWICTLFPSKMSNRLMPFRSGFTCSTCLIWLGVLGR